MVELRIGKGDGVRVTDMTNLFSCFRRKIEEVVTEDVFFGRCWFTLTPEGILIEPEDGVSIRIKFQVKGGWMESLTRETIFLLKDDTTDSFTLERLNSNAA